MLSISLIRIHKTLKTKINLTNELHQQSHSWEVTRSSAIQEIPHSSRNPEVHCRVHNSLPIVPTFSQKYPVHILPA